MRIAASLLAAFTILAVLPAYAQKAQDTVRIGIIDLFPTLDNYVYPQNEASMYQRAVYQSLILYDERNAKFLPMVAKSWNRVDETTIDFELRDDLAFHSGNKLTADDVVYTANFFADAKIKIPQKGRYDWIHPVEKLGANKVRIKGKQPFAADMSTIAYRFRVYDSKVHSGLADYNTYGRVSASGTGPYKLVSLDRNEGVVLEKFDGYKGGERQAVKRIVGIPMPEEQTRMAQLLVGGVDVVHGLSADNAQSLAANPSVRVTNTASGRIGYITLDAAGRSKNKVMTDPRVRRAMVMAIDRDPIIRHIVPGGEVAEKANAICFDWTIDCSYSAQVAGYDPAGAKKLLAEAGLADGFDLVVDVHEEHRRIAEAISGELRKVGIRASVAAHQQSVYVRNRGRGDFTFFFGVYPTSAQPDVANLMDFFFGGDRDYYQDQAVHEGIAAANKELDDSKRRALYRNVLDRVNREHYILPFSSVPVAYGHSKDVVVLPDKYSPTLVAVNGLVWADYKGD